jgi:hypothetical protein
MRNRISTCVSALAIGVALGYGSVGVVHADQFAFSLRPEGDAPLAEGAFEGSDRDGNGWIELDELTTFREFAPLRFSGSCLSGRKGTGWRSSFEAADYPSITRGLEELESFRFAAGSLESGGGGILEYTTKSHPMVKVREIHFWRQTKLTEEGRKLEVLSGVSDGTEGIEFCLVAPEKLSVEIERR